MQRIGLFIDGGNIYATVKALGFDIDYKKLRAWLDIDDPDFSRAYYYTAVTTDPDGFSSVRKLLDWLSFNRYTVVEKMAKEFVNPDGGRKFKASMTVDIAVDVMRMADQLDTVILMTGDGDFAVLVDELKCRACHVTVISSIKTQPPMCADDLRRSADLFLDLADLRDQIGKPRPAAVV